jgi:membrane protein DedA with SNARE-associated domain
MYMTSLVLSATSNATVTSRITDWSLEVMDRLGGLGAALLIALENLFPPLPSEVILPLAGFSASQGDLNYFAAIAWTTAGSLVGALALYFLGSFLGRDRVRHYADKIPLVNLSDIDKAEHWFLKHETKAVFFGRMVPIVRSMISIPAGVEKMSLTLFIVYTTIGSMIWNTTLISAGYLLGDQWHRVETYVNVLQYVVIASAIAFIIYFVISRLRRRKARAQLSNDS